MPFRLSLALQQVDVFHGARFRSFHSLQRGIRFARYITLGLHPIAL